MRNPQRLIENRTAVQKIIASMKWGWPASLLPVRCFGWFEGKFAGIPVEWFLNCGHYLSVTEEFWSWETSRAIGTALTYHALVYFIMYYLHTFWAHVNSCILWWNIHGFGTVLPLGIQRMFFYILCSQLLCHSHALLLSPFLTLFHF